jgi:aryl-alcohol dehydrogenase-like predicted oxidoreductase
MTVSAIGLGGMPCPLRAVRSAVDRPQRSTPPDAGITLIDTADAYHVGADEVGHNERLIAESLRSYGGDTTNVLVATKGGHLRPATGRGPSTAHLST